MSCIFCKIIKGKIPCYKVYEDEATFVFLDIAPVNYGHTLVIPKKHYKNLEDIPEEELNYVIKTVKRVGFAIKKGLGVKGYNVQLNNGSIAGQVIHHIHFHIIPRKKGDGLQLWSQGEYDREKADEIAEKIKNNI